MMYVSLAYMYALLLCYVLLLGGISMYIHKQNAHY